MHSGRDTKRTTMETRVTGEQFDTLNNDGDPSDWGFFVPQEMHDSILEVLSGRATRQYALSSASIPVDWTAGRHATTDIRKER